MSKARKLADLETGNKGEVVATALSKINLDYVINLKNDSTGYLALTTGTKQQEPNNAKDGVSRLNTTSGLLEFYANKKWNFEETVKHAWWGNVDIKQNTVKNVDMYFCGVSSAGVDLKIHITGNQFINVPVVVKNNKGVAKLPVTVTKGSVNSLIQVDVVDGKDNLNTLYFRVT